MSLGERWRGWDERPGDGVRCAALEVAVAETAQGHGCGANRLRMAMAEVRREGLGYDVEAALSRAVWGC